MPAPISILLLEDNPTDARLIADVLEVDGLAATIERVENQAAFEAALAESRFQLILSDYQLPAFDGMTALAIVRERRPDLPFILVSGTLGEETAVESLRSGANDYVLKQRLDRLPLAVRRALREAEEHRQRRHAEKALRQNEALYSSLVEQLPLSVFRKDRAGRYTFVNRRFLEQLGLSLKDVLGRSDAELLPRDLVVPSREADDQVLTSGRVHLSVDRFRPAGASDELIVEVLKWPLRSDGDLIDGVQGIFWDVTERERQAEALRTSECRLNQAERLAHLGSWESDFTSALEHPTLVWSEETYRIFGLEPRTVPITYARFLEHVHPDDRALLQARAQEALRTLQPYRVEHRLVRPDGSERLVLEQAEMVCDPVSGKPMRMLGTVQDITEQRRAEEQLRTLARAVDQSPVSIVITNREGDIEFVNPKFTQVTGYTAEEVLGRNARSLESGGITSDVYQSLWETIASGQEWRGELCNRRKDGSLLYELASVSPVRDADGAISHFIAVREDVTEKRLTETKLLRAQRVESIGSLASGIAHDLNNILAPILLCAPLLEDEPSPATRRELAQTIETSAQRAVGVVKQLLTFARGKEGHKQLLQVRHVMREIAKMVRETFPRNIQIQEGCDTNLWPVVADATQLHQVLLNLCVNARDAMPEGGRLTLRAANAMLDDHYVAMHPMASAGPHVRLQIEDTGTGIPEEIQEHIFESFFTTKEEGQGTGLGLTTVRGIVRDHKGFITFRTASGKGTVFEVCLPAAPEAHVTAGARPEDDTQLRGRGELILVVDDEAAVCEATRRTLERHGYGVVQAKDGIEGLTRFCARQSEIKAVITDLMMPMMDGVTLGRAVRALSPRTPIIVSSGGLFGKVGNEAVRAFNEMGLVSILHKPHHANDLLRLLAEALGGLPKTSSSGPAPDV